MGWKAFADHFGIRHIVQVKGDTLFIGSSMYHDLARVCMKTGAVASCSEFEGFVRENYPELQDADPASILKLLEQPDTFTANITVYSYEGANILESQCEKLGWPHVTHDGELMYENTHSTDKETVIRWAKKSAQSEAKYTHLYISELEGQLEKARQQLQQAEAALATLDAKYPEIALEE